MVDHHLHISTGNDGPLKMSRRERAVERRDRTNELEKWLAGGREGWPGFIYFIYIYVFYDDVSEN